MRELDENPPGFQPGDVMLLTLLQGHVPRRAQPVTPLFVGEQIINAVSFWHGTQSLASIGRTPTAIGIAPPTS